jgi:hypothetical protein
MRRVRRKTVCAHGAIQASLGGRSTSPLETSAVVRLTGLESMQLRAGVDAFAWALP